MSHNIAKSLLVFLFVMSFAVVSFFSASPVGTPVTENEEAAVVYKAKCAMCHTPKATKFFDLEKTDEEHVNIILEGKKMEKPPHMPGYKEKGMTEAEAKALTEYMRSLRTAN